MLISYIHLTQDPTTLANGNRENRGGHFMRVNRLPRMLQEREVIVDLE